MKVTDWQILWKSWSWPWYEEYLDVDYPVTNWFAGIGPLQIRGYK